MSLASLSSQHEYSINSVHETAHHKRPTTRTPSYQISWSHITQNKCQYIGLVLGLIWLTVLSLVIFLATIIWDSNKNPWNASFYYIKYLTNQQLYYIIFIIFECTVIAICILFLCQYFICSAPLPTIFSSQLKRRVPGSKHKQNKPDANRPLLAPTKHLKDAQRGGDYKTTERPLSFSGDYETNGYNTKPPSVSLKKGMKRIAATRDCHISRNECEPDRCSYICRYIASSHWNFFHFLAVCVVIFHIYHVMIMMIAFSCPSAQQSSSDSIILIMYRLCRSMSDILPGICLNMYWRAKEIYNPVESYIKKYEKVLLRKELLKHGSISNLRSRNDSIESTTEKIANAFKYEDNTKTLAAVHSILSKCVVKTWLLFAILFSLYHFLFWPAFNVPLFQQFIADYNCSIGMKHNPVTTHAYFILQMCVLRPFNGMILTHTVFLIFCATTNAHKTTLNGFKTVLTPTICCIIILFELTELRFFEHNIAHWILNGIMSMVYLTSGIWCLVLLCSLMALQSTAERQRNRFHAYREPPSAIILFEGVFVLVIYVFCFGFSLRNKANESSDNNTTHLIYHTRQMTVLIFNIAQLFVLFPLRIIGVEPDITKNYFLDPTKTKYIYTFRWIWLLNVITLIYSFIFITNSYGDMMYIEWDTSMERNVVYVLSYTFTFCMPYFAIWCIAKYDQWVDLSDTNLPYQESEFDANNDTMHTLSVDDIVLDAYEDDVKEKEKKRPQRYRNKSETEMSEISVAAYKNKLKHALHSKLNIPRSPKTIKRNKLTQRRRQSEGGNPIDINAICLFSPQIRTPSIPENYDETMNLFVGTYVDDRL